VLVLDMATDVMASDEVAAATITATLEITRRAPFTILPSQLLVGTYVRFLGAVVLHVSLAKRPRHHVGELCAP
jgi:hypothetical protein